MKKTLFMMSVLTLSLNASQDDGTLTNAFSMAVDFAYFKREQGNNHKLVIDNSKTDCSSCHFSSCKAKGLVHDFPFEPGFKVDVNYTTEHSVWDFSYLWLPKWEKSCSGQVLELLFFPLKTLELPMILREQITERLNIAPIFKTAS